MVQPRPFFLGGGGNLNLVVVKNGMAKVTSKVTWRIAPKLIGMRLEISIEAVTSCCQWSIKSSHAIGLLAWIR